MSKRDLHRLSEPAAAPAPRKGAHVRQAQAAAQGSQGARMGGDSSSSLGMPSNPSGEGPVRPRGLSVQLTPTRDHLQQVFIARNVVLLAALGGIAFAIAEAGSALRSPWAAGVLGVLGLLAFLNLFTWYRLKQSAPVPTSSSRCRLSPMSCCSPRRCTFRAAKRVLLTTCILCRWSSLRQLFR